MKVREFIHYARKNPRQQNGGSNAGGQAQAGHAQAGQAGGQGDGRGSQEGVHAKPYGGARPKSGAAFLQVPTIALDNMFGALAGAGSL